MGEDVADFVQTGEVVTENGCGGKKIIYLQFVIAGIVNSVCRDTAIPVRSFATNNVGCFFMPPLPSLNKRDAPIVWAIPKNTKFT